MASAMQANGSAPPQRVPSSKAGKKRDAQFAAPEGASHPRVNFGKLDIAALRRYRRHFKLTDVGPNSSKDQLVSAVSRHFAAQHVDEHNVISHFVATAVKRPRS